MCSKGCPELHDIINENGGLGFFEWRGGNGPASYIDFKRTLLWVYNQLLLEPPRLCQVIVTSQAHYIQLPANAKPWHTSLLPEKKKRCVQLESPRYFLADRIETGNVFSQAV